MSDNKLIENIDFYINKDGLYVFTAKYLKERGFCCANDCLHCPWEEKKLNSNKSNPT